MSLKFTMTKVVELADWDELVERTYGKPYSFQQQEDCRERGNYPLTVPDLEAVDFENDTIPEIVNGDEMGVSLSAWLARDPQQPLSSGDTYLQLWWERNFYPSIEIIANDLHAKGLLEAGDYSIAIDW